MTNHKRITTNKKRKTITVILLILSLSFSIQAFSQVNDLENITNLHYYFDDNKMETGATFNTFASSNSINNKFVSALYGKKYIDNELKNSNKLKPINYLGNQDNINAYFCHKPDTFLGTNNTGYRIGLVYHNHRDMKFTDDLFNLMFFGNKRFAGDTADISNLRLNLITYQELQFGIFQKTMVDENPFTYYIGLSFIKGQEFHALKVNEATIFTAETGEYIDLDINMTHQCIDTVKSELLDINGIGGALNMACIYEDVKHKIVYNLSISNIGFIRWKSSAITIPVDTTHRFEGLEIENLLDMSQTGFTDYNADTIITDFFSHTDTSEYYKVLPERIHFSATKTLQNNKLWLTAGFGYYYNSNARMPLFYASTLYRINNYIKASVFTGYGGYGSYKLGLGVKLNMFDNKASLNINSNNLLGVIIPQHSFSQSLYVSLAYRF